MAFDFSNVFFNSISELGAALRAKQFSAVELTRAFSDRLERLGPRYNALALTLREEALRKARSVDDELKRGRTRGPLQGIPYGAKDLLAATGGPTTWGARPFAGQVFDEDARVVALLNKAGAILIGKLSMVELAGGGGYRYASASMFGPGLNPWDTSKWSGGSSSGSGSAVAAGLVTFALGSETSGSIITPSAFCGVTGLRPTYGMVSRRGAMALSWTLDKIGPMCRSVEDCALVLHEIAGADVEDPGSAGRNYTYSPKFFRDPKDLTIGYAPVDFAEAANSEARPAFQAALEVVKSLGVKLREVELPDFPYGPLVETIVAGEAGSIFEDIIRDGRVDLLADQKQVAGLKAAIDVSAVDYLRAMRVRRLVQEALNELFLDVDLLLAPARPGPAPDVREPLDGSGSGPRPARPSSRGLSGLIPAGNLAGLPALSLPCGFAGKLPVAISLVARPFYDNVLIAAGHAFQGRTDWHKQHPTLSA
jgi:aspartyl-tRNA(Asn)/glutamyl-tRNA(Gln) amidotransferase subunit A